MRRARRFLPLVVLFGLLSLPLVYLFQTDSEPSAAGVDSSARRLGSSTYGESNDARDVSGSLPGSAQAPAPGLNEVDGAAPQPTSTANAQWGPPRTDRPAKPVPPTSTPPPASLLDTQAAFDAADRPARPLDALARAELEDARESAGLPPILAPAEHQPGARVAAQPVAHEHDVVLRASTGYGTRGALGFGTIELISNRTPGPVDLTLRYAYDPALELDHFELGKALIEARKQVSLVGAERGMAVFQIAGGRDALSSGTLLQVWFRIPASAQSGTALRVETIRVGLEQASVHNINDSMILE